MPWLLWIAYKAHLMGSQDLRKQYGNSIFLDYWCLNQTFWREEAHLLSSWDSSTICVAWHWCCSANTGKQCNQFHFSGNRNILKTYIWSQTKCIQKSIKDLFHIFNHLFMYSFQIERYQAFCACLFRLTFP